MTYDWNNAATAEGGSANEYEKLPAGQHSVRIVRVLHEGANGPFVTNSGDPKILICFEDDKNREVADMFSLSKQAGWRLAKLLDAFDPPANLAAMTADGVTPASFSQPDFASANLIERKLRIQVEYKPGRDGKEYANIEPLKKPVAKVDTPAVPNEEIPF